MIAKPLYSHPMSRSGTYHPPLVGVAAFHELRDAARDRAPIVGLTHRFYRYPARFSPTFAATAINLLSSPGDLVLDPYMGGGTTIVEAVARGRTVVGNDINSLAVFIARVKTSPLNSSERAAVTRWATNVLPQLSYSDSPHGLETIVEDRRAHNLTLPHARPLKKVLALALRRIPELPTRRSQDFVRCALLNSSQRFLNGQRRSCSAEAFRSHCSTAIREMLDGIDEFAAVTDRASKPTLLNTSASNLLACWPFSEGKRARLVVTSPPYPGIHMLYHRWQVDGRRETPAPYWLANCQDGEGSAYYNFADRRESAEDSYFAESLTTLRGVRSVMCDGAIVAQLIAFADPRRQLRRYLLNMERAGFRELRFEGHQRIWRNVPSRQWHATLKGRLNGSREVLLLHEAV